ncbi:hypothetical protein CPB85DRAFT_227378 [Mucidula mucida]|nr:hypothetical protein CPB85DRAFT_227378 [Mucidula mucida]
MQQPHRHGCALQRGEEKGRQLLLDGHILLSLQMPSLRRLVRNPDRSKEYPLCRYLWRQAEGRGLGPRGERRLCRTRYRDRECPRRPPRRSGKTTSAQNHLTQVQLPRLESLQSVSDQFNADPYTLSSKIRKQFRAEKKVDIAKRKADDTIRDRYALPSELKLLEDNAQTAREAKEQWAKAVESRDAKRRKLSPVPSTITLLSSSRSKPSASKTPIDALRARVLGNTAKRSLPSRTK